MKTEAIIVAAGKSRRAGLNKLTYKLGNHTVLEYSLSAFQNSSVVDRMILVGIEGNLGYFRKRFLKKFSKLKVIVKGGRWRSESVFRGLKQLDEDSRIVFIHDGARPFVSADLIKKLWQAIIKNKAVIPVLRIRDTLKVCKNSRVARTFSGRETLVLAHTPQVFKREIIEKAYRGKNKWSSIPDDAFLVEKKRLASVRIIESSIFNFKITFSEDLDLAKTIARGYAKSRIRL